jgi:CP family cyanate transporter-like MFS transporter
VPDFLISAGDEQEKGIAANRRHRMLLMTATVLLTAAMLRGLIASIAPVAGQVGRGLDAGPSLVGLLTSIPVLCFAACMPAAIALVRVAGTAFALTVSVTGAIFGCTLRSAGGLPLALAGTAVLGVSVAIANVVVPLIIAREYPETRRHLMTGAYGAVMNVGTMTVTFATVPISGIIGWRWATSILAVLGVAALAAWVGARGPRGALTPSRLSRAEPGRADGRSVTREPMAWLLAGGFAGQAFSYFGVTAWLPSILSGHGYAATQAGAIAALFQAAGIAGALLAPLLVRVGGVRLGAVAAGVAWLTLPAGFLAAPGLWALWCLIGGVAQASSFTVIFIILAGMPGDERRTAARSGLIQSTGYGVAAVAPVALGGLHEATGGWTLPLLVLEASCAVFSVTTGAAAARASARSRADAADGAVRGMA